MNGSTTTRKGIGGNNRGERSNKIIEPKEMINESNTIRGIRYTRLPLYSGTFAKNLSIPFSFIIRV